MSRFSARRSRLPRVGSSLFLSLKKAPLRRLSGKSARRSLGGCWEDSTMR